jgi:hypothetical protein
MKNNFSKFMREHNVDVDERTFIDINENYILSIIPEHNHHYRNENDHIIISPRDEPYSIELNVMLMKRKNNSFVSDIDYQQQRFDTEIELKEHIKKLRDELLLVKKS